LRGNQVRATIPDPATTAARQRWAAAVTLVEVMATVLILAVAVLGASGYRYYAALDARCAAMHRAAAEMAQLLCENWRGLGGAETYDPMSYFGSDLAIEVSYEGPAPPVDFTLLGVYKITTDGADYYAVLSWKDVSPGLRALNVVVAWDQRGSGTGGSGQAYKSFKLTTYTSVNQ